MPDYTSEGEVSNGTRQVFNVRDLFMLLMGIIQALLLMGANHLLQDVRETESVNAKQETAIAKLEERQAAVDEALRTLQTVPQENRELLRDLLR